MRPPRRLRVIPDAIRLYVLLDDIAGRIRQVRSRISDQLFRAALSVPLNLEEGSYEFARDEKTRLYRIAYRSLAECRVILDIIEELRLIPLGEVHEARRQLERLSPQLFNLIKRRRTTPAANSTTAPAPTSAERPAAGSAERPAAGLPPQASPRQATRRAQRAAPS